MKKGISKKLIICITLLISISTVGCTTNSNNIKNNIQTASYEKTEEEILNQKLKSIPEENQISVVDDNISSLKDTKQKVIEIYIPNYEENYLIAKTISLEVEQGSIDEYIDSSKVMDYLREVEIIPKDFPDITIGKQISHNIPCLIVDFPKKVYSLFDNYEDEKLFLDAILKSLLNIYDAPEISISVEYCNYSSNFITIDEIKYYR